jgi:hypothetical protein
VDAFVVWFDATVLLKLILILLLLQLASSVKSIQSNFQTDRMPKLLLSIDK